MRWAWKTYRESLKDGQQRGNFTGKDVLEEQYSRGLWRGEGKLSVIICCSSHTKTESHPLKQTNKGCFFSVVSSQMGKLIVLRHAKTKHINRFEKNWTNSRKRTSIGGYWTPAGDGPKLLAAKPQGKPEQGGADPRSFGLRLLPSTLGFGFSGTEEKTGKGR